MSHRLIVWSYLFAICVCTVTIAAGLAQIRVNTDHQRANTRTLEHLCRLANITAEEWQGILNIYNGLPALTPDQKQRSLILERGIYAIRTDTECRNRTS